MTTDELKTKAAEEAMEIAEASRETEWEKPSFVGDLFMGNFNFELIQPFPVQREDDRIAGDEFLGKLERFLAENVDPDRIDETGEYPDEVLEGLRKLGAFGMKIPKEYGGLGLSVTNYNRAIALIATWCGSTVAWVSAHQSIGVPQPLMLFGTPTQKRTWLPKLAAGAISAFALTEPGVGSDPATMKTTAVPSPDGEGWILNGEKLWTTNVTKAEVIVVMAQTPPKVVRGKEKKQITAFLLDMSSPGVKVEHRCQFMGLRGIGNGLVSFRDVFIPKENILWGEGLGLKLALITLNTGRLTIPAACAAASRRMLQIARDWANERVQWGLPVGRHEAIAGRIAWMASHTFAQEAIAWLTSGLADRGDVDLRLEAAMAKLFNTETAWKIVDDLVQIRGGRGYETHQSLRDRGEKPWPVERIMRDMRINRIFEGTSEIQHLFIAREAVDPHMKHAGVMLQRDATLREKLPAMTKMGVHYAGWYPTLFVRQKVRGFDEFGDNARHLKYVESTSRRLARSIFHAMGLYQAKLERKQRTLFRIVDIGTDLFAMSAAVSYANALAKTGVEKTNSADLADHFCREAKLRIEENFDRLFSNHDDFSYKVATSVLGGDFEWLEGQLVEGILPSPETLEEAIEALS